jgi:hypothetical protein
VSVLSIRKQLYYLNVYREALLMSKHRLLFWIVLMATMMVLIAIPLVWPNAVTEHHPESIVKEGSMELFQWPWYFAAIGIFIATHRKADAAVRSVYLALIYLFFCLGFRELDLDYIFIGVHWYKLWGYIGNPEIPLIHQGILFFLFLSFITAGIWVMFKSYHSILRWPTMRNWRTPSWYLIGGFAVLLASYALDRPYLVLRYSGANLNFTYHYYVEESLELFGAIILFFASLEIMEQERLATGGRVGDAPKWSGSHADVSGQ